MRFMGEYSQGHHMREWRKENGAEGDIKLPSSHIRGSVGPTVSSAAGMALHSCLKSVPRADFYTFILTRGHLGRGFSLQEEANLLRGLKHELSAASMQYIDDSILKQVTWGVMLMHCSDHYSNLCPVSRHCRGILLLSLRR